MLFAWTVVRHVRSNAIVIAKDGATLGIGAGQMSRVDSVRLAVEKCRDARGEEADALLAGSAVASDAFFPFADGPEPAIEAGATAVIQPGGSKRDAEVIEACDAAGVADGLHQAPPLPALAAAYRAGTRARRSLLRALLAPVPTWSQTSSGVSAVTSSSLSAGAIRPSSSRPSSIQSSSGAPVPGVDEDRREVLDPVGLDQGQALEHLVEGAEAAGDDDEGARVADEHQLAGEEVVEVEAAVDVGVGLLLHRQLDVEPDREAAGLGGAAVGRLHQPRPAAGDHREAGRGKPPSLRRPTAGRGPRGRARTSGAPSADPRRAEDRDAVARSRAGRSKPQLDLARRRHAWSRSSVVALPRRSLTWRVPTTGCEGARRG